MSTTENMGNFGYTPDWSGHSPIRRSQKDDAAQTVARTSSLDTSMASRKWTRAGGINMPSGGHKARNIGLALIALLVIAGIATLFIPGAGDWITKTAAPLVQHFFQNLTWQQGLEYFAAPAMGVTALGALVAGAVHYYRTHDKSKKPNVSRDFTDSDLD